jgi:hypothetical protein
MKANLHEVVELSDKAAAWCKARYGRVVQDDGDSVFVSVRPGDGPWFILNEDIKSRYVAA